MAETETGTASVVARLAAGDLEARELLDTLSDIFDPDQAVVSAYDAGGRWSVDIHFLSPPNETAVRALVGLAVGTEAANALTFERIAAKDWVKASLEGLPPVAAGRFVVHGAHDRGAVAVNRIGIEIEAALAFGTGHHGTTRGCLFALDRIVKVSQPKRILDLGTGSGVLAIAAARAFRRPVLASDVDASATRIARENAIANRAASVTVIHAVGFNARRFRERGPFGLVLANILLGPLQRLATPMARLIAPGAYIVLSGLLCAHEHAALAAYRVHGLVLTRRIVLDGWTTLVLRRPTK